MKKILFPIYAVFAFVLFLNSTGCNNENIEKVASENVETAKKIEKPIKKEEPKQENNKTQAIDDAYITISTSMGDMEVKLYGETPEHTSNIVKLANEGFYDDLLFHRVINGFMIQGGDPKSKNASPTARLGSGGPGYTIPAEFNPKFIHKKGAISAARTGGPSNPEKRSSGSQFYIVQGKPIPVSQLKQIENSINQKNPGLNFAYTPEQIEIYTTIGGTPFLDMDYTVYGEVIKGMDVIDKIANTKTAPGDRPVTDVKMKISVKQ